MFCANMKQNKLDSKLFSVKQVIIETEVRDAFSLVNVDTGATLVCNVKYFNQAPSANSTDDSDEEIGTKTEESSDSGATASDVCANTELSGLVTEEAAQNDLVVTTRSGRVVKLTTDHSNFVYH